MLGKGYKGFGIDESENFAANKSAHLADGGGTSFLVWFDETK